MAGTGTSAPLKVRLRYKFDNALARGPFVVIAYLGVLTLAAIVVAGLLAVIFDLSFGGDGETFFERAYQALLRMLDPGTFSGDTSWGLRALTLVVTLIGVILGGSLIGLIANAVDQRVDALQRGRGAVVEKGHSLILGWGPQVPQIVSELIVANESEKDASVVILAKADKVAIDDELRERIEDFKTTRVVVRNGDPSVPADLERACLRDARSVIAVRDEDGDASVIKAVLAVRALDPDHSACHVVAEVNDADNAATLRTVSRGRVVTVSSESIVAEVTAQACYQSGLASVFSDLLDFDGDEIYFSEIPELVGRTYAEAQLAFESCSVIGRLRPSSQLELNPAPDATIDAGDQLIMVASDDSAVRFTGLQTPTVPDVVRGGDDVASPVRALIVGWSTFGGRVLRELDEFLVPGSSVVVQVDTDLVDPTELEAIRLTNASIEVRSGRGGPEDLFRLREETFDQVIVLAYRDQITPSDADARTLLSLLTLRMMWPADAPDHVRIVAELVDQRNVAIATPAGIDDLIVSDALASLLMAQLSERAELMALFEDLFDPDGAVVLLKPAETVVPAEPIPFASVVAAASRHGASVFGYRVGATGEVVMNPPKSKVVTLVEGDQLITIGERALPALAAPAPKRRSARTSSTTRRRTRNG